MPGSPRITTGSKDAPIPSSPTAFQWPSRPSRIRCLSIHIAFAAPGARRVRCVSAQPEPRPDSTLPRERFGTDACLPLSPPSGGAAIAACGRRPPIFEQITTAGRGSMGLAAVTPGASHPIAAAFAAMFLNAGGRRGDPPAASLRREHPARRAALTALHDDDPRRLDQWAAARRSQGRHRGFGAARLLASCGGSRRDGISG